MQRWLLALTVLLGAVSLSEANYIIVRVLVHQPTGDGKSGPEGGPPTGGMIGGPIGEGNRGGGMRGFGGGGSSPPPMGVGGGSGQRGFGGGGSSPPPMGVGGGGAMGIRGSGGPPTGIGGGAMGIRGSGGPPTGIGGGGGAMGIRGSGGPPTGAMGAFGNLGGSGGGNRGGPPTGALGAFGNLGAMGGGGGMLGGSSGSQATAKLNPTDYVMVALEFKNADIDRQNVIEANKPDFILKHKWGGKIVLFQDQQEIYIQGLPLPTPREQYTLGAKKVKKTPEDLYKWTKWCLSVGLIEECEKHFNELVKVVEETKETTGIEKYKAAAEAYKKVKNDISRGPAKQDNAVVWKNRIGSEVAISVSDLGFYALIHTSESGNRDTVIRRLKLLDFTFKNFYLWHALKGKALPTPNEKLVALLVPSDREFKQYKSAFEIKELMTDGFYARRDNLAVFTNERLDIASRNFSGRVNKLLTRDNYIAEDLLKGKFPKEAKGDVEKRREAARAAMLFLVDKALQEEAEIASTTHEGTRQLFAASGLLPRNVDLPEWLQFGLASLFEMPKGPFPGDFTEVKVALWPGVGSPSWAYMGHFSELVRSKEIPDSYTGLAQTVTDDYFILAREGYRTKEDRLLKKQAEDEDKANPVKDALVARAKTLSWSLAYYIANERLDELHKYFDELKKLPREMELDEYTKQLSFAKAFDLTRSGLNGDFMDKGRFAGFSQAWFAYMQTLRSPAAELKLDAIKVVDPSNPTGGGFPGGTGGPVGGGGPGDGGNNDR